MSEQRLASLSLDLDNLWAYQKIHGDSGWDSYPSYLDLVVPRVLDFLDRRHLKITFFIVGQDAVIPGNRQALSSITAAGHEVANHSFNHESWLHLYDEAQMEQEIAMAHEAILDACGEPPMGFRGPGYSHSPTLIRVLRRQGYRYDASSLPTWLGPLARWYYFMTTDLTPEDRLMRKKLFGQFRDALKPLRAHRLEGEGAEMVEIPVTVMPLFRTPFHLSYLLYLYGYSELAATLYFRFAKGLCKFTGTEPSILLHPLDFMGAEDDVGLEFFPSMRMSRSKKLAFVGKIIDELQSDFEVVPMSHHARAACRRLQLAGVT